MHDRIPELIMWSRKTIAAIMLSALSIACTPLLLNLYVRESLKREAVVCDEIYKESSDKVGCWLEVVFSALRSEGISEAFRMFDFIYEKFPLFGSTGCHVHAHRLGDAAYYEYLKANGLDLADVKFPASATMCGYGFFHGFLEHYIQDRPQVDFATETCEFMRERWTSRLRDIATICYHATGHGFTQASLDSLPQSEWGAVDRLIEEPLRRCAALTAASPEDNEECREGVFNVVNEWMIAGSYGLSLDFKAPFSTCEQLSAAEQHACYYEFSQNLLPIVGFSPIAASEFADPIQNRETRTSVFGVMVAGMTQSKVSRDEHPALFSECARIPDDEFFRFCVISLVNGMMEHGDPGDEYRRILISCELDALDGRDGRALCYRTLAERLSRFYEPEKKSRICGMFPKAHRAFCNEAR